VILLFDCPEKLDNNVDILLNQKSNFLGADPEEEFKVNIDGKETKVHPNFKLYLTTKISNPNYMPETFIKSTVINFLVTFDGLEEDLLTKTVKIIRPEDEERRTNLVEKISNNDKILAKLESDILESLLSKQGREGYNVLEDNQLINLLQVSKKSSTEINIQKEESLKVNKQLILERQN